MGEGYDAVIVATLHCLGGYQGVDDCFFGGFYGGVEERGDGVVVENVYV